MNTDYLRYFSCLAELQLFWLHNSNIMEMLQMHYTFPSRDSAMRFILWKKTMDFHFLRKPVEMYDLALMD